MSLEDASSQQGGGREKARRRRGARRAAMLTRLRRGGAGRRARGAAAAALERLVDLGVVRLWLLALLVGAASGVAAVGFVLALDLLLLWFYGAGEAKVASAAAALDPAYVLMLPVLGGAVVALLLRASGRDAAIGVAEVIEARALKEGRVDPREAATATVIAMASLSTGASSGREGPAVVAGAGLASIAGDALKLGALDRRVVLGCAVAAAVSASFNAPIAGAIYALEVVLGHYALRAFGPITIASVAGALLSRHVLGDEPAFQLMSAEFGSASQFPAFVLLGLVCAMVAMALMRSIFFARAVIDRLGDGVGAPRWSQPVFAGVALGATAIWFPEIVSVGYQTTTLALAGEVAFWTCIALIAVKTAATAVTLGGRFGGGVFSPALMLGALTGAAFGSVAIDVFPSVAGDLSLYALAGMGAVSGAVLGAPISTTLIVFELTGDYETAIAVMVSTSVATVATQQLFQRSFFHSQLKRKGLDLSAGPQSFLLTRLEVGDLMRPRGAENGASETKAWALAEQGVFLRRGDTLARALPMFRQGALPFLPVVEAGEEGGAEALLGALFYTDALRAYNRALVAVHEEEHG